MVAMPVEPIETQARVVPGAPGDPGPRPAGGWVAVTDDAVVVAHLVERDPEVRHVIGEAPDPVEATHACLHIGARALRFASTTVDGALIERHVEDLTRRFDAEVSAAVERIGGVATSLLGEEEGALTRALRAHRDELDALLGRTFDPDSRAGALALIERVVTEAVTGYLDADDDRSPLAVATRDILANLRQQAGEIRDQLAAIAQQLAVQAAVGSVLEQSSQKGARFEETVHERVAAIAATHGDLAEHVGTEGGQDARRCGDEVVTVNPDDAGSEGVRFVLEVKHRRLGWRETLAELDRAMANRDARAGIAVFARQDQAPTGVPFHYNGTRAVVVLDPDGGDDGALRLAYMWARWVARRERGPAGDGFDPERVRGLIDEANLALQRVRTIRRYHTEATKGIERAGAEVNALVDGASRALEALGRELTGT